jgi:hypothetical protein
MDGVNRVTGDDRWIDVSKGRLVETTPWYVLIVIVFFSRRRASGMKVGL